MVELIIVITILAILASIAFISFKNYSKNARDGNRLSTVKNIDTGLQIYKTKTWNYPLPEDYIEIISSGSVIWYQWFFGNEAANWININKLPIDPLDEFRFTYSVNKARTLYQGITYLEVSEEFSFVLKTYAENSQYENRIPKTFGNELWVLLWNSWANINRPLQELKSESFTGIDIKNSESIINDFWELKVIFNNNIDENITSTWADLWKLENMYQWIFEYIFTENCPIWWTNNWEVSILAWGRPGTITPTLHICKHQTEVPPPWTKIIMPICPTWWNNNWGVNISAAGRPATLNTTLNICEKQIETIPAWTKIIMTGCPIWWSNNWKVNILAWGRPATLNTTLDICQKK